MTRRSFFTKVMGAVAAAVMARPLARAFSWDRDREYFQNPLLTTSFDWTKYAGDGSLLSAGTASNALARRVLVMASWFVEEGHEPKEYLEKPLPRWAHHWREIAFEELKKGDHFRLIDAYQPRNGDTTPCENGKGVYIASMDAGDASEVFGPIRRAGGDKKCFIGVCKLYLGRGAGFDWYDIAWGDDALRPARTHVLNTQWRLPAIRQDRRILDGRI